MSNADGRILVVYGDNLPRARMAQGLVWLLRRQRPVYVVDGANVFDAYQLARLAVRQEEDPHELLRQVHLSRAFTCYQMAERIAGLAASHLDPSLPIGRVLFPGWGEGAEVGALYCTGLLDTFYDANVPLSEAKRLLEQVIARLCQLRARRVTSLILTRLPPDPVAERHILVKRLIQAADAAWEAD